MKSSELSLDVLFAEALEQYEEHLGKEGKLSPAEFFDEYYKDYQSFQDEIVPLLEEASYLMKKSKQYPLPTVFPEDLEKSQERVWEKISSRLKGETIAAQLNIEWSTQQSQDITALLERCGARKPGHYELPSGRHCQYPYLLDPLMKRADWTDIRKDFARCFLVRLKQAKVDYIVVHSKPMYSIALTLGNLLGGRGNKIIHVLRAWDYPPHMRLLKTSKKSLRNKKVVILQDIVDTGTLTKGLVKLVRDEYKANVIKVMAVVNEGSYSQDNPPLESLCQVPVTHYGGSYDCPLCQKGEALTFVWPNLSKNEPESLPQGSLSKKIELLLRTIDDEPEFWWSVAKNNALQYHIKIKEPGRELHICVPIDTQALFNDDEFLITTAIKSNKGLENIVKENIAQSWAIVCPSYRSGRGLGKFVNLLKRQLEKQGVVSLEVVKTKINKDQSLTIPPGSSLTNKCVLVADIGALGGGTLQNMIDLAIKEKAARVFAMVCINRLRAEIEMKINSSVNGNFFGIYRIPLPSFEYDIPDTCPYCHEKNKFKKLLEIKDQLPKEVSRHVKYVYDKLTKRFFPKNKKVLVDDDVDLNKLKERLIMLFAPYLVETATEVIELISLFSDKRISDRGKVTLLRALRRSEIIRRPEIVEAVAGVLNGIVLDNPPINIYSEACETLISVDEYGWTAEENWLPHRLDVLTANEQGFIKESQFETMAYHLYEGLRNSAKSNPQIAGRFERQIEERMQSEITDDFRIQLSRFKRIIKMAFKAE